MKSIKNIKTLDFNSLGEFQNIFEQLFKLITPKKRVLIAVSG
jgi:hypothetical protein